MNQSAFHLAVGGQQSGPYSLQQVQGMLAAGQVNGSDYFWNDQAQGWVPLANLFGNAAPSPPMVMAGKKSARRADRIGLGALLQLVGVAFCFIPGGILGISFGVAAFIVGAKISRGKRYLCDRCGNEVAQESRLCPTCHATFKA